ncbi:hypothetical protein ACLOJK_027565 [Asimina triloba]
MNQCGLYYRTLYERSKVKQREFDLPPGLNSLGGFSPNTSWTRDSRKAKGMYYRGGEMKCGWWGGEEEVGIER